MYQEATPKLLLIVRKDIESLVKQLILLLVIAWTDLLGLLTYRMILVLDIILSSWLRKAKPILNYHMLLKEWM
jgi:hypothetical protein